MADRWQRGDVVTMRYTGQPDGTVRDKAGLLQGWPHIVVEDSERVLALWAPAGSAVQYIDLADARNVIPLNIWRGDVLRLFLPGRPFSVWLSWTAPPDPTWPELPAAVYKNAEIRREDIDTVQRRVRDRHEQSAAVPFQRAFRGWYVNLEAPFVRTPIGIDTSDNSLDVVVASDLTWRWKDEDTMDFWVQAGVFTREHVEQFYREGREAIALVEGRQFPFDGSYLDWLPEPAWPVPTLREGWAAVPGYDWSHAIGRRLPNVDHPR